MADSLATIPKATETEAARQDGVRLAAPLLGLARIAVEAVFWLLLIGGCFTYGWAGVHDEARATFLMLATALYVALLWSLGYWHGRCIPAARRWLLTGIGLSAYVLLQVTPAPWSYRPDFASAPNPPPLASALENFEIEPRAYIAAVDSRTAVPAALKFIGWVGLFLALLHMVRWRTVGLRLIFGLAIFGALQGFLGWQSFMASEFSPAVGSLYNRNHYGAMMAMLLPIMLASLRVLGNYSGTLGRPILSGENPLLLGYIVFLVAVGGLVASASRGAVLIGGLAFLCYLAHQGTVDRLEAQGSDVLPPQRGSGLRAIVLRLRGYLQTTGLWAIALLGALALLFVIQQRGGLRALAPGDRPDYWASGLRMARDYPVLGIGPGSTRRLLSIYSQELSPKEIVHLHSDWIQYPLEAGLAGTFLAMLLVALALIKTRRHWYRAGLPRGSTAALVRRAALWSVISCLGMSLVEFHLRLPLVSAIFAASLALSISFSWRNFPVRRSAAGGSVSRESPPS